MAFSMYQFTKGEGTLNTTQDLFTQAEYFAEEANRLYKVIRQFSYQVGFKGKTLNCTRSSDKRQTTLYPTAPSSVIMRYVGYSKLTTHPL